MKEKYKRFMMKNRKDIKKDISRIKELNNEFIMNDDQLYEYDLIMKTLVLQCKVFNILLKSNISFKQFLTIFNYWFFVSWYDTMKTEIQ